MANILASAIIDQAEEILQDTSNDKWSAADLLGWLNMGQRAIVREKPTTYVVRTALALTSGLYTSLPAAAFLLLGVSMNLGLTPGITPGVPITLVERKWMDATLPSWTSATASATTEHVIYDPDVNPLEFSVYPQSTGTGFIEVVTANRPADILSSASILVGDEYAEALLDYVLFRAFSRDADYVENSQRAVAHWQSFLMVVGKLDQKTLENIAKKGQGLD
jgi:hypothetical protein